MSSAVFQIHYLPYVTGDLPARGARRKALGAGLVSTFSSLSVLEHLPPLSQHCPVQMLSHLHLTYRGKAGGRGQDSLQKDTGNSAKF